MSTLFAKNGFSRPSLKQFCGVFRHVLFPQDKEGYGRFCIARRKLVCIFEESTVLRSKQPSQREIAIVLFNQASNKCDEVAKHKTSERNTRRLLRESEDDETPQRAFFASEEAHREPAESVVYFWSAKLRHIL